MPQKVLLAHYDPDRLQDLAAALEGKIEELDVICAKDGQEALMILDDQEPDLVVLSAVLPKVLGFDVCRAAKGKRGTPVVLLTDKDDGYARGRARQAGADLVIAEPLTDSQIGDILSAGGAGHDPFDFSKAGSRSHHERLLASILKDSGASANSLMAKFSDPVTGLFDRNYIRLRFEEEFKKSRRYGTSLSIVLAEIDNYDEIVSVYGPQSGDLAVVEVASVFLCESRDIDVAGRLDKARFLFLLPNTDLDGAKVMASRVFKEILERRISTPDEEVSLEVSVGLATSPNDKAPTVDDLLDIALRGVAAARGNGANKICAFGE